jgi:hypothetical protein
MKNAVGHDVVPIGIQDQYPIGGRVERRLEHRERLGFFRPLSTLDFADSFQEGIHDLGLISQSVEAFFDISAQPIFERGRHVLSKSGESSRPAQPGYGRVPESRIKYCCPHYRQDLNLA